MTCTWKDCELEGTKTQTGKDGTEWALLCSIHDAELEEALGSLKPKKLLRAWALAGKKHQTRQDFMEGAVKGTQAIAQFAQALAKAKK